MDNYISKYRQLWYGSLTTIRYSMKAEAGFLLSRLSLLTYLPHSNISQFSTKFSLKFTEEKSTLTELHITKI